MKLPNIGFNRNPDPERSLADTEMKQILGGVALYPLSTDPEILGLNTDEVNHKFKITPHDRVAEQKSAAYDAAHPILTVKTSNKSVTELLSDDDQSGYIEEALRAISKPAPKAVIDSAFRRHPKKGTVKSVIQRHPQNPNETHAFIDGIMKTFNEKPTHPAGSPYAQEFTKDFLTNVARIKPDTEKWKEEYAAGIASIDKLHSSETSPDNIDTAPKA